MKSPGFITHFFGSVRTNFIARSIQSFNWSSSSTPCGSTATQFLIGLPVMSNARTWDSRSAASPSSGPRRAMSRSFQTPAVNQKADAAEHLLLLDAPLSYQGVPDAGGEDFVKGHR
jgi:hypothetical protein